MIEGELIEWNQKLNQTKYFMDLWEVKVGKLSTKCEIKFWKCVGTGTPFEIFFGGEILMGGAVPRIMCNWIYMASLKRLKRGSGCHLKIDPVEQGGNPLRKKSVIKKRRDSGNPNQKGN